MDSVLCGVSVAVASECIAVTNAIAILFELGAFFSAAKVVKRSVFDNDDHYVRNLIENTVSSLAKFPSFLCNFRDKMACLIL